MTDNPTPQDPATQPSLRLSGIGPVGGLAAGPAPVPARVLEVATPDTVAPAASAGDPQIIPFEVRAAMVAGANQPAIRTKLVAGRMPGVRLYQI